MRVYQGLKVVRPVIGDCAVTIGNFDGVHLGHRAIVRDLVDQASDLRLPSVLVTFDPHPTQILFPERHLQRLFSLEDMQSQLASLGLDKLIVEPFTHELGTLSGARFLEERMLPSLQPRLFIVGHDFAFGAGRGGTLDFLKEWSAKRGIGVRIQPPVELEGERVSSRRIREMVSEGHMQVASRLLGRPFYVEGLVTKGAGRGKTIGIPTMNVKIEHRVTPKNGVYVTKTKIGSATYRSVSNFGVNPTFGPGSPASLETHVFDFSGDVYGQLIQVHFLTHLRNERKFSSVDELKAQISEDMRQAREFREDSL